jgi:hypothetical protein
VSAKDTHIRSGSHSTKRSGPRATRRHDTHRRGPSVKVNCTGAITCTDGALVAGDKLRTQDMTRWIGRFVVGWFAIARHRRMTSGGHGQAEVAFGYKTGLINDITRHFADVVPAL